MSSAPQRGPSRAARLRQIRETWTPDGAPMALSAGSPPMYHDILFLLSELDRREAEAGEVYEVIESTPPVNMGWPSGTESHGLFRTRGKALRKRHKLAGRGINATHTRPRTVQ